MIFVGRTCSSGQRSTSIEARSAGTAGKYLGEFSIDSFSKTSSQNVGSERGRADLRWPLADNGGHAPRPFCGARGMDHRLESPNRRVSAEKTAEKAGTRNGFWTATVDGRHRTRWFSLQLAPAVAAARSSAAPRLHPARPRQGPPPRSTAGRRSSSKLGNNLYADAAAQDTDELAGDRGNR
jgi:hypothetical protein